MKTPEGKIVDQIQTRLKKLKAEGHHLFWFKVQDAEHRVWCVAATRATKRLLVYREDATV